MSLATTNPTAWALRQALNYALREIVVAQAIPAINQYISTYAQADNASLVTQFDPDTDVRTGIVAAPSKPALCIVGLRREMEYLGTQYYQIHMWSQIQLRTPWTLDNTPEDFEWLKA